MKVGLWINGIKGETGMTDDQSNPLRILPRGLPARIGSDGIEVKYAEAWVKPWPGSVVIFEPVDVAAQ